MVRKKNIKDQIFTKGNEMELNYIMDLGLN